MEPLVIVLIPGIAGGFVLALLMASSRYRSPSTVVPRRLAAPTPSLINMAHIRVEGIGGLGLVAAVIAVALADPRIRTAVLAAGVLGAVLACALIALRRGTGALPSGGAGPDGSVLHLDPGRPAQSRRTAPGANEVSSWLIGPAATRPLAR